jgi:hypothetical protein
MKQTAMSILTMLKRNAHWGSATALTIAALTILMIAAGRAQGPVNPGLAGHHSLDIGAANVVFTSAQLTENRFAVVAFVPTGSSNDPCLVTLAESNFAIPGISVFCGPPTFEGRKGIGITVSFPQPIPDDLTDFVLSVTVYQEGARGYGTPVFYPGN